MRDLRKQQPNEREPMTTEEATIDVEAAQERLGAILRNDLRPTLTGLPDASPTHLPAPNRKPRSDKGIPKRPPADPDEITLKLTLDDARQAAFQLSDSELTSHIATKVQDQIIGQLQKRLDLLTKQK